MIALQEQAFYGENILSGEISPTFPTEIILSNLIFWQGRDMK